MGRGGGVAQAALSAMLPPCSPADDAERSSYLASVKDKPLVQQTVVTCMDTLQRDKEGDKEVGRVCTFLLVLWCFIVVSDLT
jgi:hypothetical protein